MTILLTCPSLTLNYLKNSHGFKLLLLYIFNFPSTFINTFFNTTRIIHHQTASLKTRDPRTNHTHNTSTPFAIIPLRTRNAGGIVQRSCARALHVSRWYCHYAVPFIERARVPIYTRPCASLVFTFLFPSSFFSGASSRYRFSAYSGFFHIIIGASNRARSRSVQSLTFPRRMYRCDTESHYGKSFLTADGRLSRSMSDLTMVNCFFLDGVMSIKNVWF